MPQKMLHMRPLEAQRFQIHKKIKELVFHFARSEDDEITTSFQKIKAFPFSANLPKTFF